MPVDPALVPILEETAGGAAAGEPLPPAEARARAEAFQSALRGRCYREAPSPAAVRELEVPVPGATLSCRAYLPEGDAPFPLHVYLHGGGWWLGSVDGSDAACRELCAASGALVVSVGYRLAPEHPYPTPPEDCYAALCWVADHAAELGGDPERLSVGGESAGGNLAAVAALMARDRGGPDLCLQVLSIPVTDLTMSQPSVRELSEGYQLTWEGMLLQRQYYLPDPGLATEPYVSPLHAPDLAGLAPAVVSTMEYDPLRDEGEAYARRLVEAGVPTLQRRFLGQIHGSAMFTAVTPAALSYYRFLAAALRAAWDGGLAGVPTDISSAPDRCDP
ncbi:MAG: alpha/beta hydrolase [Acidimicrobiaceae bacterium]|jgi:acetyl esterase|nr:alpha/beta hydrolase [Acidimicrobiaceae bacterium]